MNLFRKIIELVDQDVSVNSRPISFIGMVVPFVPIMIFVDGSPTDKYPILSGMAMAISILWGLFVIWRYIINVWTDLRDGNEGRNPLRFGIIFSGVLIFIILLATAYMWLSSQIGWPESYNFTCHGRGCWIDDLLHSPALLRGGSMYELSLFALLWFMPAILVGCAAYAIFKRRRRNPIQPMD